MSTRRVVIIGASTDRRKFGNKSVRAHLKQGWTVYPVNPHGGEIEGLRVYRSIDELLALVPPPFHRMSLYVPPDVGITLISAIARCRPGELFLNPGAESEALVEAARAAGLEPLLACSIVDIGLSPHSFP